MPKPQNPDERSQPDKFRDLAEKLDCNEDEARFEDQVRKVATSGPSPESPPTKNQITT